MDNQHHTMHLDKEYFNLVKTGDKQIEFRVLDDKRKKMKIGDTIQFICKDDKSLRVMRCIINLSFSANFLSLLDEFSEYQIPEGKDKLLTKLKKIYNNSDANSDANSGVVAIFLGE